MRKQVTDFGIKQGKRFRQPKNVLHDYQTIANQTTNAQSVWEKALLDENKRRSLAPEYSYKPDTSLLTNQFGVASTSLSNYSQSKFKLDQLHIIGV